MALGRVTFFLQRATKAIAERGAVSETGLTTVTRASSSSRSGAILPEPKTTPFGFVGVVGGVVVGLFIGAAISKNVANFLEENELFVPSDDDDDDD